MKQQIIFPLQNYKIYLPTQALQIFLHFCHWQNEVHYSPVNFARQKKLIFLCTLTYIQGNAALGKENETGLGR